MKKYAHLLLLFIGISVSVVAAIRLLSDEPADSLRQLRDGFGLRLLAFMFAPFILLTVLGLIGRVRQWSRDVQQSWLVTNLLITLGSAAFYFPRILEGERGCMDSLVLLIVPYYSWPVMLGVWLLTWLTLRARNAIRAAP